LLHTVEQVFQHGAGLFSFFTKHKRLEAGSEPTKRPTRHTGDVSAPDQHAVKGNPQG